MPLVNKREMARLIECSVPTLDALIAKHADFPVHRRGSNGVAWEFDPDAVVPFLATMREAEERDLVARADALQQYTLPGLGRPDAAPGGAPDQLPAAKPRDILDTLRAQRMRHDLAKEAGHLVWVTDVRRSLNAALSALNQSLGALPSQLGRRFNLPDPVVQEMTRQIEDQQAALRDALRRALLDDA